MLYGPQSTLYASSTPGGIVNIVSATPKTDKFEASGTLELGNYNLKHIEGAVNAPVIDTIALRAAVSMTKRDGYLTNGGDDEDSKSARLRALFKPNDKFSFLVTGEITKVANYGFGGVTAFINQDDVDEPWTSAEESAGNARKQPQKKIYGTMDLDLNFANLTITPSYSKSSSPSDSSMEDPPGSGNIVTSVGTRDNYEKGIEVRMASSEDFFFKWITGIILYKSLDEMTNDSSNGSYNRMHNLQQTKAFYGNVTYPVTDRFRATGGFRITNDKNDSYNLEYPPRPGRTVGGAKITHMKYTNPDFKVGIEYDVSEKSMLYSDLSSSYRT